MVKGEKWWNQRKYNSVDGNELRESGRTDISNPWIDAGSYSVPGRDYIHYHHIHCLPSRIRHIIQRGFRVLCGHVERHDSVCRVVATRLWKRSEALEESRIQTAEGLRKPDLVVAKDVRVCMTTYMYMIVSGQQSLDVTPENKMAKYRNNRKIA